MARYAAMDPQKPERIREAVLELVHRYGPEKVSMEQIAARAGLAKGTLYLYFPCKQALMEEVAVHCSAIDLTHSMLGVEEQPTHAGKLHRRICNILSFCRSHPRESALLRGFYQPVNVAGTELAPFAKTYAINREYIRLGVEAGEFRALPLELLCQVFYSAVEGLCTAQQNGRLTPELVEPAVDMLLEMLRA